MDTKSLNAKDNITREEVARIIGLVFGVEEDEKVAEDFLDAKDLPKSLKGIIGGLKKKGFIAGYLDGSFRPKSEIKRAEVVKMLYNISGQIVNKEGIVKNDIKTNLLVNTAGVVLKDMIIEGDLYLTEGIGEGDVTLDNVEVKGELNIKGGGENSIKIKNSKINKVSIDKQKGLVRVVFENSTVEQVKTAKEVKLELTDGTKIKIVELDGKVDVLVEKGTAIVSIDSVSKEVVIQSKGTIESIKTTADLKVNGKKVKANTESKVNDGKTTDTTPKKPDTNTGSNTGGSSNSGGSSSGGSSKPSRVLVNDISIIGNSTVINGQTLQLSVSITPSNASNKEVTWSLVSGPGTVDIKGLVTATGVGKVIVKAKAKDGSGIEETKEITVAPTKLAQATEAVEVAETCKTDVSRTAAQTLVTELPDGAEKSELQDRIDAIVTVEDEAARELLAATNAVITAEITKTNTTRTEAQSLVTELPDGSDKTDLQDRLDSIISVEDVTEALVEAKATAETKVEADYTTVSWKVLTDALAMVEGTYGEKTSKTTAVNDAIDALITKVDAAKEVAKAELDSYKDIADYTVNEIDLTSAISTGKTNINSAVTTDEVTTALENAKAAIDDIESDGKIVERKLLAATSAVVAAETSKTNTSRTAAQTLVTALPEETEKIELQNRLNEIVTAEDILAKLATAKENLDLGDISSVVGKITLPGTQNEATVTWVSDNIDIITNDGTVKRPVFVAGDATVILTATLTVGTQTHTKEFTVTVKAADPLAINIKAIEGVTAPVRGETPVTAIGETEQYAATISWDPSEGIFDGDKVYTATITLTPKDGYILEGISENFFIVEGASTTNAINTGVIIAVFPATEAYKEITGYTALEITLDTDEHLFDLASLKASSKLPTTVTVTDGITPIVATITDWTGSFDGTTKEVQTLTAAWKMPVGYIDIIDPITVEVKVNVNAAQTNFAGGSGQEGDPYQVSNVVQLDNVRNHLDSHFIQTADINLGVEPWNTGGGWIPIGEDYNNSFKGFYDGSNFEISGLTIDSFSSNQGLFGYVTTNAHISNISLLEVTIKGGDFVGGLVGQNSGNIINSYATGSVNGSINIGGLVGNNIGTISKSYATVSIEGNTNVGGLVGMNNNNATIYNSYALGMVSGTVKVGGLVGLNASKPGGNAREGIISNSYATGSVNGETNIGGLVGSDGGTISNSYYDSQTTGQSDIGKGVPKKPIEMGSKSTFNGWDFTEETGIWRIDSKPVSYPYFKGQKENITHVPKTFIDIKEIEGVTAPVTGEEPVTIITNTNQYTGTVNWSPEDEIFKENTAYTVTINLTPKDGWILEGIIENFFTVEGAITTNDVNTGLITAVFPATDYYQAVDKDFNGETNGTFKYIGLAKYVIIPDTIKGKQVTSYAQMFAGTDVEGVKGSMEQVTNMIGMFQNSKAKTLDLSNFNTSNVTIMQSMFEGSIATTLDLSSFDTSNVETMAYMFKNNHATTLDLSSFNTSKVTSMNNMFQSSKATSLDLSKFNTASVNKMDWMFYESLATTLDLSSFNTKNIKDMSRMFRNSHATTLNLSSFDTSNVTDMLGMFEGSMAESLDLSSFNTSNVTDMRWMFSNSHATSLDLSSFNTEKVTNMESMFAGSKAITGYARTQTDADRFNESSNKPAGLNFIVPDKKVTAISNGIASSTGTTTITLGEVVTDLAASDVTVKVNEIEIDNSNGDKYTLDGLETSNVTIEFLAGAALDNNSLVTVEIIKAGYDINGGAEITVENTIKIPSKVVSGITTDPRTITLTMDKALTAGNYEGGNDFMLSGSLTNVIEITNVNINGKSVTLTLNLDIVFGDEIGVQYVNSFSDTKLTGEDGDVDNFYYGSVTNTITAVPASGIITSVSAQEPAVEGRVNLTISTAVNTEIMTDEYYVIYYRIVDEIPRALDIGVEITTAKWIKNINETEPFVISAGDGNYVEVIELSLVDEDSADGKVTRWGSTGSISDGIE